MTTSVAMCTYNGEKFLQIQIESILNQTRKLDEIVVCDDGSNDKTIEILESYNLKYPALFKIYRNSEKLGSIKNFEKAISMCTKEIIFLSDQDDIWIEKKAEDYIRHFENNIKIAAIATNGFCIDEQGIEQDKYAVWDVPQFLKEKKIAFNYFDIIVNIANIATGASMAFKRSLVNKIIPIPIVHEMQHDEWIALLSLKEDAFLFLDEKYFYYRIHEKQQLGGVFHDKTALIKKQLTNYFDLLENTTLFLDYKKRLKKLILSYEKNKLRAAKDTTAKQFFIEIATNIENEIYICKSNLKSKYALRYFLMALVDRITGKRQFKKINFNNN